MARLREDRSEHEWLELGHCMLSYLDSNKYKTKKPRLQLRNEVKMCLEQLKEAHEHQDNNEMFLLTEKLNSRKYDYGDAWKAWIKKLSQTPIDIKRTRTDLYVEAGIYFEKLKKADHYKDGGTFYDHLFRALQALGISKIDQLYDIQTFLSNYQDYSKRHRHISMESKDEPHFDVETALSSIIELLKKREISNFHELEKALSKRVKENNMLEKYQLLRRYIEREYAGVDVDELIKKERDYHSN
ncbi:hypothetical protein [Alteromonas lipotrueae]|uniref:hypothetical protein n=1 Tax=Alteromonas lipotrueae TaxID=2803814 RepID=UPI001C4821AD|nr:hypothetical protein [Alteromonas lipotrueae]